MHRLTAVDTITTIIESGDKIIHDPAITCTDLTKFYGPVRGIEGLNLDVKRGEVFGFLGPNGAGKTTTIRLLLDLIRSTRGHASILGHHCRQESLEARRSVGYLPGEFNLYEDLTGRRLLKYLFALRGDVHPALVENLAVRLNAPLDRRLSTLSHGNKQKIALILAFAPDPEVLILDEPTNGLDPLVRHVFQEMLGEARARGRTVFLSSHDMAEVEKACDRIASVRLGRLIAVESVAELQRRAHRLVELVLGQEPQVATFAKLDGVDELHVEGHLLRCRVHGPLGPLLEAASPYEVIDVISRKPGLEEFFLAQYQEGTTGNAD